MARLGKNGYGKSRVRLSRITRYGDRHDFQEWTVRVIVQGDFDAAFTEADNSLILPTDTMKNTVYALARNSKSATLEEFALELGDYLLDNNEQMRSVEIEIAERAWKPLLVDSAPEPTTFRMAGPERHTVRAERERSGGWNVVSGIEDLTILKTTRSAFEGYKVDRLTTLPPASDRIFGTAATVRWEFTEGAPEYARVRSEVLTVLLREFAAHESKSVQHTLFAMGKAALDAVPQIARITLAMPNLHHLLANLSPFGQDNPNHIFVPIDEPHGSIEATIER